jgi:hypothetical protein
MKLTHGITVIGTMVAVIAFSALGAGATGVPVPSVPEPGTLTLLSSAIAVGVIGVRWFRRR